MCPDRQRRTQQDRCLRRKWKSRVIEIGLSAKSSLVQSLIGESRVRLAAGYAIGPWFAPLRCRDTPYTRSALLGGLDVLTFRR